MSTKTFNTLVYILGAILLVSFIFGHLLEGASNINLSIPTF